MYHLVVPCSTVACLRRFALALAVAAAPPLSAQPLMQAPGATAAGTAQAAPLPPVATTVASEPMTLQRAYELQRESNRSIRAALRQADIAAAEVNRVNVRPNPSLTAQVSNGEAGRYRPSGADRILRLDQLIERGGKRQIRTRQAQLLEQAARLDLAEVTRQQRLLLAQAYFELVAAQDSQELASENLDGYRRLLSAAERRASAGDLAAVDVSRLRVEGGRAANELRSAQAQTQQAQVNLAAVLGRESTSLAVRASDPLPGQEAIASATASLPPGLEQLDTATQLRRADILAARLRVDAAEQAVELAQSLRARDVSIGLQTERSPALGGNVFGVSASIPLFINNDYAGDIARALAERDAAQEELARLQALVRIDLERASGLLRAAADRALRLYSSTLPDAQKVVTAIEFAFSRGAATLTDLFDARRQSAAVRAEAIAARADFAKAYAGYQAATTQEPQP